MHKALAERQALYMLVSNHAAIKMRQIGLGWHDNGCHLLLSGTKMETRAHKTKKKEAGGGIKREGKR